MLAAYDRIPTPRMRRLAAQWLIAFSAATAAPTDVTKVRART
jgi:hypothetical protein